jgi:hypothetical protein
MPQIRLQHCEFFQLSSISTAFFKRGIILEAILKPDITEDRSNIRMLCNASKLRHHHVELQGESDGLRW